MHPNLVAEREKLKQIMLYIAWKEADDPRFGETKFNKLLFFSNAYCFGDTGKALLDRFCFVREKHGPILHAFLPLKFELLNERLLTVAPQPTNDNQSKLVAREKPSTDRVTSAELVIIDATISKFWDRNGTEMSEFSHELPAWEAFPNQQKMRPGCIFVRRRPLTARESAVASTLTPSAENAVTV